MQPTDTNTSHSKLMLLILAVVLLVISVGGYFISQSIQNKRSSAGFSQTKLQPTVVPTLIPYPKNGSFVLKKPSETLQVGKTFSIDLVATSGKSSVAGYDVVLSYDKTAIMRQSVQNLTDSFRIYTYDRTTDRTSISATKNIQITQPVTFSNTTLLRFTFTAKKAGTYIFSLKPIGAESSKMVNEAAEVTYPDVSDISLEIK